MVFVLLAKFVVKLCAKTRLSPLTLLTTGVPSIDKPFSHPVTIELKQEVDVFLLKRNAFSNFSPMGNAIVPFPLGPTMVPFEKIGIVLGCAVDPAASLSDSKQLESPGASNKSLSRIDKKN